jgi:hypothetical protein
MVRKQNYATALPPPWTQGVADISVFARKDLSKLRFVAPWRLVDPANGL